MLLVSSVQDDMFATMVSSLNTLLTAGGNQLLFWTGTPPATLSDPDVGTLVSSHPLPSPPLLTPSGTNVAFDAIPSEVVLAAGTVTYARLYDVSSNAIVQFTCGTGSEEIVFDNNVFGTGDTLNVSSLEINGTFS